MYHHRSQTCYQSRGMTSKLEGVGCIKPLAVNQTNYFVLSINIKGFYVFCELCGFSQWETQWVVSGSLGLRQSDLSSPFSFTLVGDILRRIQVRTSLIF